MESKTPIILILFISILLPLLLLDDPKTVSYDFNAFQQEVEKAKHLCQDHGGVETFNVNGEFVCKDGKLSYDMDLKEMNNGY